MGTFPADSQTPLLMQSYASQHSLMVFLIANHNGVINITVLIVDTTYFPLPPCLLCYSKYEYTCCYYIVCT
jgi:hypothetical protein